MKYPKFYSEVPNITLYDPLSDFLGSVENGIVEISYLDVVKYSGHSCPTVAGAYLMTLLGLEALKANEKTITRSEIKVIARGPKGGGTNGVIANVAAYICGVNDESGFAGIGGNMSRRNKLFYDDKLDCDLKFEYKTQMVKVSYNPSMFPPDPEMIPLMQKLLANNATTIESLKFKELWVKRVKKILLSKDNYKDIINISN